MKYLIFRRPFTHAGWKVKQQCMVSPGIRVGNLGLWFSPRTNTPACQTDPIGCSESMTPNLDYARSFPKLFLGSQSFSRLYRRESISRSAQRSSPNAKAESPQESYSNQERGTPASPRYLISRRGFCNRSAPNLTIRPQPPLSHGYEDV
jgi:hypothetical protein